MTANWFSRAGRRRLLGLGCAGLTLLLAEAAPAQLAIAKPSPPADAPTPALLPTADPEVLPIDLPTALRLANASNPTILIARRRVDEAYALQQQAQYLWLPNLQLGSAYQRHDGQIQETQGTVLTVSRSSVFVGGGATFRFETSEALFGPLIARQLTQAQAARAQAITNNVQYEVASAYLELLGAYGELAVLDDIVARGQEMLRRAEVANRAEASHMPADVNRVRAEVSLRVQERYQARGRVGVAAAHLARLLLLRPTLGLVPADPAVVPITLVPTETPLDDLVMTGLLTRPELAASRSLIEASRQRLRLAKLGPLLPRLQVDYLAGGFGGGPNSFIGDFNGRGDGTAQMVWELKNLGFGNVAQVRERRAQYDVSNLEGVELQAQVGEQVTAAALTARARRDALDEAQLAVREALKLWERMEATQFEMIGPKNRVEFDSIPPVLALQTLQQARERYLNAVIDYNRAQFQLYTAMGQPALEALPKATAIPVQESTRPVPYSATRPKEEDSLSRG